MSKMSKSGGRFALPPHSKFWGGDASPPSGGRVPRLPMVYASARIANSMLVLHVREFGAYMIKQIVKSVNS